MTHIEKVTRIIGMLDEADVPPDLRVVAFAKLWDAAGDSASKTSPARESVADGAPLDVVASRLGVERDQVDRVYSIEDGHLELVVPAGRLQSAKSKATEQIALLVVAGRQASGIDADGWTGVDEIRVQCENYKRHDSGNFATTIKGLDEVLTVRGQGRDRKLRMTNPAYTKAAELVNELTGGAG